MDTPIAKIEAAFGWPGFPDALFYEAPWGLRFDLADGVEPTAARFLRAIDRSRAVAHAAFANSSTLAALASSRLAGRRSNREWSSFQHLRSLGFPYEFGPAERVWEQDNNGDGSQTDGLYRYWWMAQFPNDPDAISALLWASVAAESDVRPKARWLDSIYIVDFENRIALNAYDARGMDLVAIEASALTPIYEGFSDWLFEYDRAAMDAKFRPLLQFARA